MVRLSKCEFHFTYPRSLRQLLLKTDQFRAYPDNSTLRTALAQRHHVTKEEVIIRYGAIDALQRFFLTFRGKTILLPDFTWAQYHTIAQEEGVQLAQFAVKKETNSFAYDFENLFTKSIKADAILLPSPNNPSGTLISEAELQRILERVRVPVIVDAAYWGFGEANPRYERLLSKYSNLCVVYSFSKYWGMPGIRCGYALVSKDLQEQLKIKESYLSGFCEEMQEFIVHTIGKEKEFAKIAKQIITLRNWFNKELERYGVPFKCHTNYALMQISEKKKDVYVRNLKKNNIEVKSFEYAGEHYLRIDIAPMVVLKKVLLCLEE